MKEKKISIDTEIFKSITSGISEAGQLCYLDSSIMDYLGKTTCNDTGKKLSNHLVALCDSADTHMAHVGTHLPTALNKLCKTLVDVDKLVAGAIKSE